MLHRHNYEFLTLIVTFLKKLSIFEENVQQLTELDVVPKLGSFVPHENTELQAASLRLLLNLSFHPAMRRRMVDVGLVPRLADLLREADAPWTLIMKLLYHLSMDPAHLPLFVEAEATHLVMKYLLTSPGETVHMEPVALAVNLAQEPRNAAVMCRGKGLKLLLKRALKSGDPVLLKLVRTLARHPATKELLLDFVDPLASEIHNSYSANDTDMLVEVRCGE